MNFETILYEIRGNTVSIILNRPESVNAQSLLMSAELDLAFDMAEENDDIRCIILGAEGRNFSAGHDLTELFGNNDSEMMRQRRHTETRMALEEREYVMKNLRIRHCTKPVIGRVQGHCVAAGLMLVAMTDFIIASDDAQFSNPVGRMAGCGVELLVEAFDFGFRRAKQMLLTGDSVSADDACRLGFVNDVVPRDSLESKTQRLAERIAKMPPHTARLIKKTINHMQDMTGYRDALQYSFMAHMISQTTLEWDNMHDSHIREGKTFREFRAWRDATFAAMDE